VNAARLRTGKADRKAAKSGKMTQTRTLQSQSEEGVILGTSYSNRYSRAGGRERLWIARSDIVQVFGSVHNEMDTSDSGAFQGDSSDVSHTCRHVLNQGNRNPLVKSPELLPS
jgi:hypothetical protein